MFKNRTTPLSIALIAATLITLIFGVSINVAAQVQNPASEGIGVQGKISSPPPTQAPTISTPANGAVFSELPITVSGVCTNDLLVKVFKNNVFSGSAVCTNGSYSVTIDLFSSKNDLTAKLYDALDQAGPSSNKVSVTFNDNAAQANVISRVSLTSTYARRGANPGQVLTWPIIISGGEPPYAISVDWGDGTGPDVYSAPTPGSFDLKHKLEQAGVYRALVKAADKNGTIAYLQLVAIGNGEATQGLLGTASAGANGGDQNSGPAKTRVLWEPLVIAVPLIIAVFWLGKRHEYTRARQMLAKGENPFSG
jgi:hypothetical protein